GARPGRPARSRHLHDDDAAAGSGTARGARDRGRGGVPGRAAQHLGELRRGDGVAARAEAAPRAGARSADGRRAAAHVRGLGGRAAARAAARPDRAVGRQSGGDGRHRVPGDRVRAGPPVWASAERHGGLHGGVARTTPDYFALQVLNTISGGAFTSRLNQNLRETHGYTYGAFSQFSAGRMAGPFVASASVVTAKTDSSLLEFLKELRRIRDEAVPEDELAKAKAYITLELPGDFETTAGAASRFRELLVYGLPSDYFEHYAARINAVTAADVQRVARQYIDPEHFDIVVVGDKAQIEAGIRALGEGSVLYRDMWGQELK